MAKTAKVLKERNYIIRREKNKGLLIHLNDQKIKDIEFLKLFKGWQKKYF